MRFLALWFPDWPVQALGVHHAPTAIERNGHIYVCSNTARQAGVRRGMRVRQAQAVCPQLEVTADNAARDARAFEQIIESLEQVVAGVEVLRPGLAIVDVLAAARYYDDEAHAVEMLINASALQGVDSFAGVADEITTAMIAARVPAVVPPGMSRQFLAAQPIGVLHAEEALAIDAGTVRTLQELGLRTLGEVAEIGVRDLTGRFGTHGLRIYRVAVADTQRRIATPLEGEQLALTYRPEDPIIRVDTAAFLGRQLASELHMKLQYHGLICQRLQIQAEFTDGDTTTRIWRTKDAFSETAIADRIRWQLDGWLNGRASASDCEGGIIALTLDPIEVMVPENGTLWGGEQTDEHVRRVVERVQSTLGPDRVLQPYHAGGRGVATRVQFITYGEQVIHAPIWNGAVPGPHPALLKLGPVGVAGPVEVELWDAAGASVTIDDEALMSAPPVWMEITHIKQEIIAWAGPWPEGSRARIQVVTSENAYLLCWRGGNWEVEGSYGICGRALLNRGIL
ncbi:MAG: DNA polymerase Y family protein [Corynebacterium sp.]|nr:DNA polymerase Y family protein [Corynebacterium sp.]